MCGGSDIIVSNVLGLYGSTCLNGSGTKVVVVLGTKYCFCLELEMVPKGMDIESLGVGWREVDEVVLIVL